VGEPGKLYEAVLGGAREAIARLDINAHHGLHPRVGVLDVAPIVYLSEDDRGAACAEALVLAEELGRLGVPVYLYGDLGGGRTRAELRRPGALDDLDPDFGPRTHPTAGATLVAARPPLIAFNVTIDADLDTAKAIARRLREDLDVRALGLRLTDGIQVSTNIEDHTRVTAAEVVAAVRRHARVTGAELVAPAPRAALEDFPEDVPLTSIYSRGDGVVWWEACTVPYARNVEVTGSHVGLAFNRKAYRAVAEALSAMAG